MDRSPPPPPPRYPRSHQPRRQVNPRKVGLIVGGVFLVILLLIAARTSYDYIEPGQVGVVKNNLLDSDPEVVMQSGIILHLPFGITDVYHLDKRELPLKMAKEVGRGDRRGSDNVKIKVADGSNVEVDVSVNYRIRPEAADLIITRIGQGIAFKDKLLRGYIRAILREKYGSLTLETVTDPASRNGQNEFVKKALNDALNDFGVEITVVNTTNFVFNSEYNRLVKEKKATAQDFRNQGAAQEQARKEQETMVASATREKNTSLIEARGSARKRIVEAENRAKQLVARAKGEAYSKKKEGDRLYEIARNEAQAVEAEGLNKATGIKKLAEAYRRGGAGLVKEALARKLVGARIKGRPYSYSEDIKRIKVDKSGEEPAIVNENQ